MTTHPFNPARYPDEDFKTYQLRRWNENMYFKELARARLFWNSFVDGTYTSGSERDKFQLEMTA